VPLVWVFGTGTLVVVASLRQSLLVPRYELLVVPGVALLAASATAYLSWSRLATLLLGGAVLFNAGVIVERGGAYRPEEWRQAQAFVSERAQSRDGIVFAPTSKSVSYEHYQVQTVKALPDPVLPRGPWGDLRVDFSRLVPDRPSDVTRNVDAISRHDRMWLVVATGPGGGPSSGFLQATKNALGSASGPVGSWQFGRVTVQLYDLR